jgi:hypothetical protein
MECPTSVDDAFYGQDAQYGTSSSSTTATDNNLVDNGDGTVTDRMTGLMWRQDVGSSKMDYPTAIQTVDTFNLAGYTDWRVPTIKELYSLIDFRGQDPPVDATNTEELVPFLNDTVFPFQYGDPTNGERIIDAQFVTSTVYVSKVFQNRQECFFGVNFADGRIKCYPTANGKLYFVMYVRNVDDNSPSVAYGSNDYVSPVQENHNVVLDQATGLMWSKDDSGIDMNWEEALEWVITKNDEWYAGHNDWRLPNSKELQSIVDYSRSPDTTGTAAIDPIFTATAIINELGQIDFAYYWSSTTHVSSAPDGQEGVFAAYVAFGRGMGMMNGVYMDVHGAGCQRSDPKSGNRDDYPTPVGPQGDIRRVYNYVRLVRTAS